MEKSPRLSDDYEQLPVVDTSRIKHPKYLKEILAQVQSYSVKAGVYLQL